MRKLTFTANDRGAVPFIIGSDDLTRGPGSRLILSSAPSLENLIQVVPLVRADNQSIFDRKNRLIHFTCTVRYEFSTAGDAFTFVHSEFPRLCPSFGLLVAENDGASIWYPDAGLQTVTVAGEPLDVSFALTYNFVVSTIRTQPPS